LNRCRNCSIELLDYTEKLCDECKKDLFRQNMKSERATSSLYRYIKYIFFIINFLLLFCLFFLNRHNANKLKKFESNIDNSSLRIEHCTRVAFGDKTSLVFTDNKN